MNKQIIVSPADVNFRATDWKLTQDGKPLFLGYQTFIRHPGNRVFSAIC